MMIDNDTEFNMKYCLDNVDNRWVAWLCWLRSKEEGIENENEQLKNEIVKMNETIKEQAAMILSLNAEIETAKKEKDAQILSLEEKLKQISNSSKIDSTLKSHTFTHFWSHWKWEDMEKYI